MEDQATVLARLLAIAATATASSLVDNDRSGTSSSSFRRSMFGTPSSNTTPTSFSNPSSETSFDGFLAGLRSGLLAAELSNSLHNANQSSPRRAMNFFRMFRFTTSETANTTEPNLVPILIVGVRAVENSDNTEEGEGESTSTPLSNSSTSTSADEHNEPAPQVPVTSNSTEGSSSTFGSQAEQGIYSTSTADESLPSWNIPRSSGSTLPANRTRDSLINALNERYGTNINGSQGSSSPESSSHIPTPSIVMPSMEQASNTPALENQSRQSWIVYVFGGTYPENHPILLAPTLFSDDPSYEDLMILESFMGQVKPPVATKEEVKNAGGLFKVGIPSEDGTEPPNPEGHCLICLSDFVHGEECRMLSKCSHSFHSECIDQWLITGRNSCPLCRSEGVKKTEAPQPTFPSMPTM